MQEDIIVPAQKLSVIPEVTAHVKQPSPLSAKVVRIVSQPTEKSGNAAPRSSADKSSLKMEYDPRTGVIQAINRK